MAFVILEHALNVGPDVKSIAHHIIGQKCKSGMNIRSATPD